MIHISTKLYQEIWFPATWFDFLWFYRHNEFKCRANNSMWIKKQRMKKWSLENEKRLQVLCMTSWTAQRNHLPYTDNIFSPLVSTLVIINIFLFPHMKNLFSKFPQNHETLTLREGEGGGRHTNSNAQIQMKRNG